MVFKAYFPIKKLRKLLIMITLFIFLYLIFSHYKIKPTSNIGQISPHSSTIKSAAVTREFDLDAALAAHPAVPANPNVHIFYYAWYANVVVDKAWKHWDHRRLPHWNEAIKGDFDQSRHAPPADIGADFYPALGLYSSRDGGVRDAHMRMLAYAGVGVVVMSWYPGNLSDPNGGPVDDLVPALLEAASRYGLQLCLHVEPYAGRTAQTVVADVRYIASRYGTHTAYHKRRHSGSTRPVPVVFVYDSYRVPAAHWRLALPPLLARAFLVGLHLERDGCAILAHSRFHAAYTYFVSPATSYASSSQHWPEVSEQCARLNVTFLPSIGPGYKDLSVRPWNSIATQDRDAGAFYRRNYEQVLRLGLPSFGITSFNEWHEGTQVEPAVPHAHGPHRLRYDDYGPGSPMLYLDLTRAFIGNFSARLRPAGAPP